MATELSAAALLLLGYERLPQTTKKNGVRRAAITQIKLK